MYKIGVSSCGFPLTEENFKKLNEAGISAIEISMSFDKYKDINYKELKGFSEKYNVGLWSYHLPFWPFVEIDPSSTNKAVRDYTINLFTEYMDKATDIGVDKFIIHSSGEPICKEERAERIKYAMESFDLLAEIAHKRGAVIAVEDLPRTCLGNCSDEIKMLTSANDKLRVCLDSNHLFTQDNVDFIKELSDKIITIHVSDYDFINERHWLPGEGKVDWIKLLTALNEVGYNGVWLYEINLEAPDTIIRDRNLTFDDFYNNAKTLFSGKIPIALGKPNV